VDSLGRVISFAVMGNASIRLALVAALGLAAHGGVVRADAPASPEPTIAPTAQVDRPLILPEGNFGARLSLRSVTGDNGGIDRGLFDYSFLGVAITGGSGRTDISLGLGMLVSQPDGSERDALDRAFLELQTGAGQSGAVYLRLVTFAPTEDEEFRRQLADTGVRLKRSLLPAVALLAEAGIDFAYLIAPALLDDLIDDQLWLLYFHLRGGAQVQLGPRVALSALASGHLPIANNASDGLVALQPALDPDTALGLHLRAEVAPVAGLDLFLEVAAVGADEPYTSVGETTSYLLGLAGRL
jgi:hypothetical protein